MIKAYIVSAFTANGSGGNKAGVVLDADKLSDEQMLKIAQQLGYSETAFVTASKVATYRVRFFTTTEEVDLCGHATIATWSLLLQKGHVKAGVYTQETLAGTLGVHISSDGSVFMQQTQAELLEQVSYQEVATVLNTDQGNLDEDFQPQVVSTGLRDILVTVRGKDILINLRPDFSKMISLSRKYDVTGLHVFTMDDDCTAIARNFAPLVGIEEESATGTSNGALLCYLKANNKLKEQDVYRIEQGESMGQLSEILGKFIDERVWIGGKATLLGKNLLE